MTHEEFLNRYQYDPGRMESAYGGYVLNVEPLRALRLYSVRYAQADK
jgi:hypothetical protein